MNDKIKSIISYIIVGFVCLVIGAGICGFGVYKYTEKRISEFNEHVKIANEYLSSLANGFYETKRFINEAVEYNKRIEQYNKELTSGNNSIRDKVNKLEELDRDLIDRFDKYGNSK